MAGMPPELQLHLDLLQGFHSLYLGMLAMGLFYGLTLCSFSCMPLLGPYIFGSQAGFQRGFDAAAIFIVARIFAYTLLGGLSGLLGGVILERYGSGLPGLLAGGLILLVSIGLLRKPKRQCQPQRKRAHSRLQVALLGFSTSLMPCLPLSAVLVTAAGSQSASTGALLALMFGIGASASPLYYIGGALGWFSARVGQQIPHHAVWLRLLSAVVMGLLGLRMIVQSVL